MSALQMLFYSFKRQNQVTLTPQGKRNYHNQSLSIACPSVVAVVM